MAIHKIKTGAFLLLAFFLTREEIQLNSNSHFRAMRNQLIVKDTLIHPGIDSLKWIAYAMNFYERAIHFENPDSPKVSVFECDVNFYKKDRSRQDTLIYFFSFYHRDVTNKYMPERMYFNGIGYSYKAQNYFPMLAHAYPTFALDADTCKAFFERRIKAFEDSLQNYTGGLSLWLVRELQKKRN